MRKLKLAGIIVGGLMLPLALSLGTYAIASSQLGVKGTVPPVQGVSRDGTPAPSPSEDRGRSDDGRPSPSPSSTGSGRCSEAEHAGDPTCSGSGGTSTSGSSGSSSTGTSTSSPQPEQTSGGHGFDDHGGRSGGGGDD